MFTRPVLWVAVALAVGVILTASVRSSKGKFIGEKAARELAVAAAGEEEEEEEDSCCGAGANVVVRPALERLGSPDAPVKVVGFLPDTSEYNEVVGIVRKLAGSHADVLSVTLYSTTTVKAKAEMEELGQEGAGFFVNGRKQFTLRDKGGAVREVVFENDPTKDYKPGDVKTVIEQAIAEHDGSDGDAGAAASADDDASADVVAHGEVR